MDTLKEEIERILDDCEEDQHQAWVMDKEKATIQLQKLFISKQIELLTKLYFAPTYGVKQDIQMERNNFESELKQLQ